MAFLKSSLVKKLTHITAATLLVSAVTHPVQAAEQKVRWKLQSALTTSLPILGESIVMAADRLQVASAGNIKVKVYEPGKIVPPFSVSEAVKNNQIPVGFTWLGYDQGRIPASALLGAVPFMEADEFAAWWFEHGGKELAEAVYAKHDIHPVLCGLSGPESAGWYRHEINSLEDLQGLKIRFGGLGGTILQKAGASVVMLPAGEVFPALEKGIIDAGEFSLPIVDQRLGLNKILKNSYYPSWHQPFTAGHLIINRRVWNELTDSNKAMIENACTATAFRMLARSEALEGRVIHELQQSGVNVRKLNPGLVSELKKLHDEVMSDLAGKDADFKRIYESQQAFMQEYKQWKQLGYLPRDFE